MKKATHQTTKLHNRDLVLSHIFGSQWISRADLARITNLTRTTVSEVVHALIQEGLVQEIGKGKSLGGKSPTLLSLVKESRYTIALNLAHNQFTGAILNLRNEIQEIVEQPIAGLNGLAALEPVHQILAHLLQSRHAPIVGIGVGTPGFVNTRAGGLVTAVNLGWKDLPLGVILEEKYGLPVKVLNDSQAAAIGEFVSGAKPESGRNIVVVKAGYGIGSGILLNGHLFQGDGGGAGEIGHVVVQEGGELCRCGRRGCLETVASARAVMHIMNTDSLNDVLLAFKKGDLRALQAVEAAGHFLGLSLANLSATLNIHNIILTGAMTAFGERWMEAIHTSMQMGVLSRITEGMQLEIGKLDERACLYGASAFLFLDDYSLLFGPGTSPVRLS